jgi:hypothetical protein
VTGRTDATSVDLLIGANAGREVEPAAGGGMTFARSDGSTVTLIRAYVTVSSIELLPCPPSAVVRFLRALSPVGVAYAHGVTDGPRFARPHVYDVLSLGETLRHVGTVKPLPGRYCTARVELGPAPEGEGAAAAGMVGLTFDVQGSIVPTGGGAELPFQVQSSAPVTVDLPLGELHLAPDQIVAETFTMTYGGWLDGVDPGAGDAAALVLAQVAGNLSVGAGGEPPAHP